MPAVKRSLQGLCIRCERSRTWLECRLDVHCFVLRVFKLALVHLLAPLLRHSARRHDHSCRTVHWEGGLSRLQEQATRIREETDASLLWVGCFAACGRVCSGTLLMGCERRQGKVSFHCRFSTRDGWGQVTNCSGETMGRGVTRGHSFCYAERMLFAVLMWMGGRGHAPHPVREAPCGQGIYGDLVLCA